MLDSETLRCSSLIDFMSQISPIFDLSVLSSTALCVYAHVCYYFIVLQLVHHSAICFCFLTYFVLSFTVNCSLILHFYRIHLFLKACQVCSHSHCTSSEDFGSQVISRSNGGDSLFCFVNILVMEKSQRV